MKPSNQDLEKLFENEEFRNEFYKLAKQYDKKDRLKMSLDDIRDELRPDDGEYYSTPLIASSSDFFVSTEFDSGCTTDEDASSNLQCKTSRESSQTRGKALANFNFLIEVRDFLRNGWKPDYEDVTTKYCVHFWGGCLNKNLYQNVYKEFDFKTEQQRDRFLELCRPQLEKFYEDFR